MNIEDKKNTILSYKTVNLENLKIDFLTLKTQDLFEQCVQMVSQSYEEEF